MSNPMSLAYYSSGLAEVDSYELTLMQTILGPQSYSNYPVSNVMLMTGLGFSTQAEIDDFLGTSGEFLLAQLDATAMPVGAGDSWYGGVIKMEGQCRKVRTVEVFAYDELTVPTIPALVGFGREIASLTSGVSAAGEIAVGSEGNIAFKVNMTGMDTQAQGTIVVKITWQPV